MSDDTCKCKHCLSGEPTTVAVIAAHSSIPVNDDTLIERQQACIEELLGLVGYLPEAVAVLDHYGVIRANTRHTH